jgi:hypothetical protein
MSALGWTFMVLSVVGVLALVGWCYYKVLTLPPE